MRKILIITRYGIAALAAITRRASLTAFGAGLAVTLCCSSPATAQSSAQQLAPTTMSLADTGLITGQRLSGAPTVDASYSVLGDSSQVQSAAYFGGLADRLGGVNTASYCPPDPCNPGCDVSYYVNAEALYLRREGDERFSLSRNTFLPDFEYEWGGRFTLGHLWDCVNGVEATYVGPFDWNRNRTITDPGNLNSRFTTPLGGGIAAADIDAFNGADIHSQDWRARMQSIELNRRWWTWDVLSTMIGVRYIDYEEDYRFTSTHAANGIGLFANNITNQLIGAQVGADLMYPVNLRTSVGFRGKGGVYGNFMDSATVMTNDGSIVLNSGDSRVDLAGLIEAGVYGSYQLVPSIRFTAGYEFWYMPGVATVPEQLPQQVTLGSGTDVRNDDSILLHGASVGVQVLF